MVSADKLGQVCNLAMPCPQNYLCIMLETGATSGICTIPCNGATDTTTCSAANGFPGPGAGTCITGKDQMGNVMQLCTILCGAQFNLSDMCPTGLTCQDKINGMTMMPGTDGKNDICAR
jgi:hypothetical protein